MASPTGNTDNPHVYLAVRGVADDASVSVVSRDYISHGQARPQARHEIHSALAREVEAERWTRLGAAIRMAANDLGFTDVRPDDPGEGDPQVRRLAVGPLQTLERMGLATAAGSGQWIISIKAEPVLRDLGTRGDIIKAMHRAFTERGQDRGIANANTTFVADHRAPRHPPD